MLETVGVNCPYCGEPFDTSVDCSAGDQSYVEDCPVCCRPVEFRAAVGLESELLSLDVHRDDD